jgi:hypothetical protein
MAEVPKARADKPAVAELAARVLKSRHPDADAAQIRTLAELAANAYVDHLPSSEKDIRKVVFNAVIAKVEQQITT